MATYKDDLDILKAAKKDANKLSLNAITELDNKGMLGMYGGGSGSGDVKTAKILFETPDNNLRTSRYILNPTTLCVLTPAEDPIPAHISTYRMGSQLVSDFNAIMATDSFAIAPVFLTPNFNDYTVNLTGDAEMITISEEGEEFDAIYVKGDCTITFVSK